MPNPKKAVAKNYASAYSDDSAGRSSQYADRLNALNDSNLGGSFAPVGKKQNNRQQYRDRRSGKTFYVNQRGEFTTQGGTKVNNRFTQGLEERITGAVDKNFNNQFEEEQRALGNRSSSDQGPKSLEEQLTSRGIEEGKSVAQAGEAAKQVQRENRAYDKAVHNTRSSTGTIDQDEVARRAGAVGSIQDSPVTKKSPFLQVSGFAPGNNPYAVNYSTLSDKIGATFDEIDADRNARADRELAQQQNTRAQEQHDQMRVIRQQQTVEGINSQQKYLNSGDDVRTKNVNVNSKLKELSRGIADSAGALTKQLNNNEIDVNEFATRYGEITAMIPQLKQGAEFMNSYSDHFATLDPKNFSDANDPEKLMIAQKIATGDPSIDYVLIEGVPTLQSFEMQNGEPVLDEEGNRVPDGTVNMPIDQLQNLYQPLQKVADPQEGLQTLVKELEGIKNNAYEYELNADGTKNYNKPKRDGDDLPIIADPNFDQRVFNKNARNKVKSQFDIILNEQGVDGLKSLAKDYFPQAKTGNQLLDINGEPVIDAGGNPVEERLKDLDSDELNAFLTAEPVDDTKGEFSSRLEQVLEGAYVSKAENLFNDREIFDADGHRAQQRIDAVAAKEARVQQNSNKVKAQKQQWDAAFAQSQAPDGNFDNFFGQTISVDGKKQSISNIGKVGDTEQYKIEVGTQTFDKKGKAIDPVKTLTFKNKTAVSTYLHNQGQSLGTISQTGYLGQENDQKAAEEAERQAVKSERQAVRSGLESKINDPSLSREEKKEARQQLKAQFGQGN